jgi:phosphoribosylformylglycinamidine (FGAM) synthase-like enzyme
VAGNPRYARVDPGIAAELAVVEAIRNVVAVGARPRADRLFELRQSRSARADGRVRGRRRRHRARGTRVGRALRLGQREPLQSKRGGRCDPALADLACVGTLADVSRSATQAFKRVGSALFRVGTVPASMGGSVAFEFTTLAPEPLTAPDYAALRAEIAALLAAHEAGLVLAAHDVSDGGTLAALAEMSFHGGARIGAEISGELSLQAAFGEPAGTIVETAEPEGFAALCAAHGAACERLGETLHEPRLRMTNVLDASLRELEHLWSTPLLDFYDEVPQA